jgi:ABC-type antimicrobial peptide transport system permease subunit
MILSQGASLAVTGIAVGVGAALLLTRLLSNLVYGVSTLDPLTFTVVPLALGLVALVASFIPARRAASLDPALTLRR